MPRVSVIVPNYNHAAYLAQRIDSILAQTYRDFELIVLDDASTDDSIQVIDRYVRTTAMRFYRNASNSGSPFIQWNLGVEYATGEYIWIAESDDFAAPTFLAELVPLLDAHQRVSFAYCQSWRVNPAGEKIGTMLDLWDPELEPTRWTQAYTNNGRDESGRFLLRKNTVPNASAAVFRRDVYRQVGGAPTDMRLCGDWLTWARLMVAGEVAFSPTCLNFFRHHPASVRASTSWQRHLTERWRVQSFILSEGRVPPTLRRTVTRQIVREIFDQVLPSAAGERLATLSSCLQAAGPILLRSPFTAAASVVRRMSAAAARRISGHPPVLR